MTEVGPAIICPKAAGEKLEKNICGLAAPYRETRVVNEEGAECAPDEPGELQIRGRGIMLGYYKRPDANADTFDGDWLRTGDLFVKDADGYHRIVGRLKEMIKRAGENISAHEQRDIRKVIACILNENRPQSPKRAVREPCRQTSPRRQW